MDVSYVPVANVLCENHVSPERRQHFCQDLLKTFWRKTELTPRRDRSARPATRERSYVSTPNKNSFDIQIASAFFRRVVFVQGNCADFAARGSSRREENL